MSHMLHSAKALRNQGRPLSYGCATRQVRDMGDLMSVVFSALGWLAIVLGGGWVVLAANAARSRGPDGSAGPIPTMAAAMVMTPGFGLMFAGLLLLAIGAVLWHLGRIDRNTADAADLLERLIPKKP